MTMNGPALPPQFEGRSVPTPGGDLFLQVAGEGPAVLLLHGYCQTGDMWGPLATELVGKRTVVVPDLAGLGRSARPRTDYEKRLQARDLQAALAGLGIEHCEVVGHDIGAMVAYPLAANHRDLVTRLVVMDAPLPGIEPWQEIAQIPELWHFNVRGEHAERLVEGRERIWFDRFWDFAADPEAVPESARAHYAAQYAAPGAMAAGFAQFATFAQDAEDNVATAADPLRIPVFAVGGELAMGEFVPTTMRNVATDVSEWIVPGAGHWLLEEATDSVVTKVSAFLEVGADSN
jgi:pimeloyl-ACP methyl ester carboxylesterase